MCLALSGNEIRTLGNNNTECLLRECCGSGDVINVTRYSFALWDFLFPMLWTNKGISCNKKYVGLILTLCGGGSHCTLCITTPYVLYSNSRASDQCQSMAC